MKIILKYNVLRKVVEFSSLVQFIVGVFAFIYGCVLMGKYSETYLQSNNLFRVSYILLIVTGGLLFISGAIGLFAWKFKSNCTLVVYIITTFLLALSSATVFGFSIRMKSIAQDMQSDTNCQQIPYLIAAKQLYEQASSLLCSNNCPCRLEKGYFIQQDDITYNQDSVTGVTKVQDCVNYQQYINVNIPPPINSLSLLSQMMESLEHTFECSGFCNTQSIYIFSDTTNGLPSNRDCKIYLTDFILNNISNLYISSLAVMVVSSINCLLSLCLFFHRNRRNGIPIYHKDDQQTI